MNDRAITIIMISVILIIIVNIGLNISLLLKKTSEDFTIINKDANTSSKSRDIIYTPVAEFDQNVNMVPEVLNFSIELLPNQDISKYLGSYIRIDGLSDPIALELREQRLEVIQADTYKKYDKNIPSYPILVVGEENKFTLTYKNKDGDITLKLNDNKYLSYSINLSSIVEQEKNQKKITISFGSIQPTKWMLL